MLSWFRRRRRAELLKRPLAPEMAAAIRRNVRRYRALSAAKREELHGLMQIFLSEKEFVACGELESVTDEMRHTIAAYACILLLGRETDPYPDLRQILVYPEPFVTPVHFQVSDGLAIEEEEERDGESWQYGAVVLSWASVLEARDAPGDAPNVAYHEFAHQLDQENGAIDGAPLIRDPEMRREWAEVFAQEYERLKRDDERGRDTLMDPYGAEHPAEFFAVATETFFDLAREMKAEHPELYSLLSRFYAQDPASDPRSDARSDA